MWKLLDHPAALFLRTSGRVLATLLVAVALTTSVALAQTPDLTPPQDAVATPSGLITKILTEGTGDRRPDGNDFVNVHFQGWTPDGNEFENTYLSGQPRPFDLSTVFPGWSQGIQMMVIGEKRRLWIPSHLAPANPAKGPSGPVVFDVELLGIAEVPSMPSTTPPDDAERTTSGAYHVKVGDGSGEVRPTPDGGVLVNYFAWTTDGKLFDNTIMRGRPTLFLLDQVMAPFSDTLQQMLPGEKRQLWIPGNLAQGQWMGSPEGMLIFHVELVQILDPEMFEEIKRNPPPRPPGS